MTRNREEITITEADRDHGKTFVLNEMPSFQAELWAGKALHMILRAGRELPPGAAGAGVAGLAATFGAANGVLSELEELHFILQHPDLSEVLGCIKFKNPAGIEMPITFDVNCQIEEIRTWKRMRFRLLTLHTGFSMPVESQTTGLKSSDSEAPST